MRTHCSCEWPIRTQTNLYLRGLAALQVHRADIYLIMCSWSVTEEAIAALARDVTDALECEHSASKRVKEKR